MIFFVIPQNINSILLLSFLDLSITITSLENRLDSDQRSEWNQHKSAKVIVLMDEDTGSELIENPSAAENFQLPSRCPLKIIYDALVTVSL